MAQQKSFAEAMKTVQTANDRTFVILGSDRRCQRHKNMSKQLIGHVVELRFTTTSRAIDQLTHSLNFFDHCVLHTKHFSNLVSKVEYYTSCLNVV